VEQQQVSHLIPFKSAKPGDPGGTNYHMDSRHLLASIGAIMELCARPG
jgi:hypothetical protein